MSIIDLSRLPVPAVIETLDYETLLAERKAALIALFPADQQAAIAQALELESEPLTKHLQENAYRELILRQRINEAAQAGMVATAMGADLDNIAARYQIARLPGESDTALRERIQLAFYQVSATGPRNRYRLAARNAHPDVVAADAWMTTPGVVYVGLLTRDVAADDTVSDEQRAIGQALFGNNETEPYVPGTRLSPAFTAAHAHLFDDDTRVLGVDLRVREAVIKPYQVTGTLIVPPGPDPAQVASEARAKLAEITRSLAQFRVDIYLPALKSALLVNGARTVQLDQPVADIICGPGELAVCTAIDVTVEVRHD